MSWASVVPKELSIQPMPLIVLTGLDIKHNAIHNEVWEGFNSRSNQKFRYKLLDGDHEYPKCKNKRPTEIYVPKGIFKANWFNKHLFSIPSLVVVFFDLDWDEPNWKEKQMECATKMELVRHSLLDRNTRIILVLIQKHPSILNDSDNVLARERYPALCTACSIKNNYLFLLHAEHLHGYINKLEEDAFTEPSQTYYTLEIKAIKFKRDSLIKVTHQYLFVRLAIKIAFFNEMKSDTFKAIEYYKQAYLSVLDIRFYDTNILEIKTVAGIINYKLCQLFFEIKHPIDAIDQFRKHIDIFRIKVGSPELAFEHSAWLCKQFQLMGELFENAIRKGLLSAVQTQHPGFYFHSAANHTIQRRLNCKEFAGRNFSSKQWTTENPSPIELLNHLEFYGQRPWRQGQQGMEILDQQKERDGILCLQELELKENLTPLTTKLFKQAITHFKEFNCKRMKQYLSVCMAEEYYYAKEYQEALNIYVNVLNDYNNEHWWPILTSIMSNALKCAFLVADITNFCLLSIELMGKNILLSTEEKSTIQSNLLRVLSNQIPNIDNTQIDKNVHSVDEAIKNWENEFKKSESVSMSTSAQAIDASTILETQKIIPAHVSGMVPFVECKAQFTSAMFNSNQRCELVVFIRTDCVGQIQFDKLYVRFNLSNYNQYCLVDNKEALLLVPNKIYAFKFSFLPQKTDIGKELEVNSISLELGSRDVRVLVLHWKGDCKNALTAENQTITSFARLTSPIIDHEKLNLDDLSHIDWNSIFILPITNFIARKANIEFKLEHKIPIFVDEYYSIKLTIENKEENSADNLSLTAEFQQLGTTNDLDPPAEQIDPKLFRLWIGDIDKNTSVIQQTKALQSIEAGKQLSEMIFVQMKDIKAANLVIKVKYDVEVLIKTLNFSSESSIGKQADNTSMLDQDEKKADEQKSIKCTCIQEDQLKLESINPFKFDFSLLSMQMKPIAKVRLGEPFLLLSNIRNETPYSLTFKNSFITPANNVMFKPASNGGATEAQSFLKDETLKPLEMATECFCLVVDDKEANAATSETLTKIPCLGDYFIEWRRRKILNKNSISDKKAQVDQDQDDSDDDEEESENSYDIFNVRTKIVLPEISAEPFPFLIEASIPTYGSLSEPLKINYKIHNKTQEQMLDLECTLEQNEYFGLSGKKLEMIQIMPNNHYDYQYVVQPLQAGYCKLPNFHIKLNNYAFKSSQADSNKPNNQLQSNLSANFDSINSLDSIIQNMIPSQIFIFPDDVESILDS